MKKHLYTAQLVAYCIAWVFYIAYGILQFITKPGTRFIFPVALYALVSLPWLRHTWFLAWLIGVYTFAELHITANGWLNIAGGVVLDFAAYWVTCWVYVYLSRLFGLALGIFPTPSRPMRPLKPLEVPQEADKTPAPVKIAVPRLAPRQ